MKIVILKFAAMGDVLRTTCILPGLKEKYPDGWITWVTEKTSVDLLKGNPYIDEILAYNAGLYKRLKEFDLVINLDEDEDSCRLASRIGGKILGFYWKGGVRPTPSAKIWHAMSILGPRPINDILKRTNRKTYQQHMLDILGLDADSELSLKLDDENVKFADQFAKRHRLDGFVVGLNTGAGARWPLKSWSVDHTARLAERLVFDLKATVVLLGGPEEKERNQKIRTLAKCTIVDAGCDNSLRDFAALIGLCDVVVTSDSLALHMASALKKKIVVFFGVTSAAEIELYGRGVKLIASERYVATYHNTPELDFMADLSVDDVFKAVKKVR